MNESTSAVETLEPIIPLILTESREFSIAESENSYGSKVGFSVIGQAITKDQHGTWQGIREIIKCTGIPTRELAAAILIEPIKLLAVENKPK